MAKGYISNLHDLQEFYNQLPDNVSTWNIYHGWRDGNLQNVSYVYRQSNAEMSRSESWLLLERMLRMNAARGGDFTVYFHGTAKGTSGARVFVGLNRDNPNQVAGIGGIAPQVANPYQVGMMPVEEVEKRIAAAVEKERLETRIAALEAQGKPDGFWSTVLMRIAENPSVPGTLIGTASNLMNVVAAKVAGLPIQMNANTQVHGTPATETEEEVNEDEYQERCDAALGRIQLHFNDLPTFLEGLAGWIESNPEMAKNLFNSQLKKQQ